MNPHSHHRTNGLHLVSLTRWLVIVAFLGAAGLSYVYLVHQLNCCGAQRKALEQNLQELIGQNNGLESQINRLTSRSALQRRLDEGFIKLVPISTQAIVRVRPQDSGHSSSASRSLENQFQTVSRDGFQRP